MHVQIDTIYVVLVSNSCDSLIKGLTAQCIGLS